MENITSEGINMETIKAEKAEKVAKRREDILKCVSQPGGSTGNRMAAKFKVARGTILKDIAALRRQGYPIQVSSMITEDGMYVAVYELPKYRLP